jgi:hypothetical protein
VHAASTFGDLAAAHDAPPDVRRTGDPPYRKDEEIDELFGFKMGADEFTRKPFSHRVLVEHVKAVLRRAGKDVTVPKKPDASKLLERGLLRMDPERHTCTWKNEPVTLTVPNSSSYTHSPRVPAWSIAATL